VQIAERREESRLRAARLMLAGQPPPADDPFDGLTPQVSLHQTLHRILSGADFHSKHEMCTSLHLYRGCVLQTEDNKNP